MRALGTLHSVPHVFLIQMEEAPALGWEGLSWSSVFLLPSGSLCWCLGALAELYLTVCLEREFFPPMKSVGVKLENSWCWICA